MGSRAIAVSPDGKNVYVASSQERRDRDLQAQPAHRRADPAERGGGVRRRQRRRRLRHGDRARRPELGRGQPRRPQRLRDLARQQLDHRLPAATRKTGALTPAARPAPAASPACRSRSAPAAGRWSGPTWSSSAPTARTSTSAPSSATRSPSSTATRPAARSTQPAGSAGCIAEAISGCALGIALGAPEGMAISGDGASVYVATRALQRGRRARARPVDRRARPRRPTAAAASSTARSPAAPPGVSSSGANAVAVSPGGDDVYVDLAVQQQRHLLQPLDHRPAA